MKTQRTKTGIPLNVAALRKAGYKVKITHYRHKKGADKSAPLVGLWEVGSVDELSPTGGKTVAEILAPGEHGASEPLVGEAICSTGDTFNRGFGVTVALGRALRAHNRK